MERKKTPPAYGDSPLLPQGSGTEQHEMKRLQLTGPIMVACHWNMLSPVGPALQEDGGSRPRSINSWHRRVGDSVSRLSRTERTGRYLVNTLQGHVVRLSNDEGN
jgi:hypothetical protein